MPRETNLLRVKLVAHTLLDVQIQETALSPVIVSHPFTSSGISALRNEDGSLSIRMTAQGGAERSESRSTVPKMSIRSSYCSTRPII